eukprot:s4526_g3.t1
MPDVFAAAPSGAFASVPVGSADGFSFASGPSNPSMSAFPVHMPASDDEECCTRCGMYYMDDEYSSGTESDDMAPDNEARVMYGELEADPNQLGGELYEAYMLAKKRWRRFSGRPPRRYRKYHNNSFRQRSNFQRLQRYGKTYAAFLPPNAFAAHENQRGRIHEAVAAGH